jgi:YidC/Oxa1 family membrane protein insertase
MWDSAIEAIRAAMFVTAQACNGSLGAGVLVVSLTMRLMLLPLTLRLAARARAHQAAMAALAPELERLRERYAKDPMKYWQEAAELMREHGIRPADPAALVSMAIQAPVLFALFTAVRQGLGNGIRFLWIRDLAKADIALALLVTVLTGIAVATAPAGTQNAQQMQIVLGVAVLGTALFLWTTASTVALSVGAGAAVSLLQNWLLARPSHGKKQPGNHRR